MREGSVIHQGQHVFVPDFTFHHEDGTEVLFEIVGYWTPEYLEQKRATLRRFRRHRILVAVLERSLHENAAVPEGYLVYKTARKLVKKLGPAKQLHACYEAGPCGYVLYLRQNRPAPPGAARRGG